jgi:hypothetical protein
VSCMQACAVLANRCTGCWSRCDNSR